ncbi:MAG: glutaredoxin domain-containing protein [Actinomycetota bacterium]|nr:glutaredoxin domain-containing protein [Actinomycetota bacterium]
MSDSDGWTPDPGAVVMFSTVWCGYCQRLKAQMMRGDIPFTEIDIEANPGAAHFVETHNGGNQTVPTVVFPDGTTMTNPPYKELVAKLESLSG